MRKAPSINGKNSVLKTLQVRQLPLGKYGLGEEVLNVVSLPALLGQHFTPTSIVPAGVYPMGLGKNLGVKRMRIAYNQKQTKWSAGRTYLSTRYGRPSQSARSSASVFHS